MKSAKQLSEGRILEVEKCIIDRGGIYVSFQDRIAGSNSPSELHRCRCRQQNLFHSLSSKTYVTLLSSAVTNTAQCPQL